MGTVLSTFILLIGSLITGVLSSVSANYSREKNWEKAKMFSGFSMGSAIALILLTLFIVVKGHTGAGEITGIIEEMAFGVMISFIFMTLVMVGVTVLNILALIEASNQEEKSMWKSVGAAILSFGGFIVSLFIIIFLL
ncbi:MAG TPA: hypothetical protein PKD85_01390 [Saprospiraceae bacterium]|nr:hypothetical protein [Saprospiraceae bacterium]